MWAFHDSIRDIIRMIRLSLQKQDIANLKEDVSQLLENMLHMMSVEEMRLFPNAHSILLEEDWNAMIEGEAEIGWVDKDRSKIGADMAETTNNKNDIHTLTDIFMKLDEGRVTKEQVNLIFKYLPVDITFVDENDKVAFYNRGDLRVFPRSAGVIGREVRFCHPPKSVGTAGNRAYWRSCRVGSRQTKPVPFRRRGRRGWSGSCRRLRRKRLRCCRAPVRRNRC